MKNSSTLHILVAVAAIALFSGCMTPITVQTDPPGATVYCRGWGRPSYKWKRYGVTEKDKPVTFRVPYNTIHTAAKWHDANGRPTAISEEVETKLLFREDPVITLTPMAR